jgi:hypothetical protein
MTNNSTRLSSAVSEGRLSEHVYVRGRFTRSAHLEKDYGQPAEGREYHLTEVATQALEAVRSGLSGNRADRALSIIGPYGSGKSAFCIYLAEQAAKGMLASSPVSAWSSTEDTAVPPGQKDPARGLLTPPALLPVLVVGARQPLGPSLVTALFTALDRAHLPAIVKQLREKLSGTPAPRQIADLFVAATLALSSEKPVTPKTKGSGKASANAGPPPRGLLLIIDEMGKFLEFAALHPQESDVFVLQEIAEASARSSENSPLLTVTVLHQTPDAYARSLGRNHQLEWRKVAERFRQVPFFPTDHERIDMVGRALHRTIASQRDTVVNVSLSAIADRYRALSLPLPASKEQFNAWITAAFPFHPLVLLALPPLFRKAGQSHRSLFTFLNGQEAYAFGRFLKETPYPLIDTTAAKTVPLYTLDLLFDYAAEALIAGSGMARVWAEAREIIDRAEILVSPLARRVLRVIALLGLLREPRLPATQEIIELALTTDTDLTGNADLAEAIRELKRRRFIVFRRNLGTYQVWEGGDLDIEAEIAAARAGLSVESASVTAAASLVPMSRQVARRHSDQTGVLRTVQIIPTSTAGLSTAIAGTKGELAILLCLATTVTDVQAIQQQTMPLTDSPNLLVAVAVETDTLREAALDLAASERVAREADGLESDRAARRELNARREESETAFRAEWERLFTEEAHYLYRGDTVVFTREQSKSSLSGRRSGWRPFLSEMADNTYPHCPILRNELINRRTLSAAAAAGRRSLIEAMLNPQKATLPQLDMDGFPPERSMYECVLRATGLHRPDDENDCRIWGFFAPDLTNDPARLAPVWKAMEIALFGSGNLTLVSVPDLFSLLSAPPYGVTEGVLPVLLCTFLLVHQQEVTFYREGTFVPEPKIADYEVLLRRPELFAIGGCRLTGTRAAIVTRLAQRLQTENAVVPIVRSLLKRNRSLPDYAFRTRRLPPVVLKLREAFDKSRSPETLLFVDIPRALGLPPVRDEEGVTGQSIEEEAESFFTALNSALKLWNAAYPARVEAARDHLLRECGIPTGEEGWEMLRERAIVLEPQIAILPSDLVPLIRRSALPGDIATSIDSVLAAVANRPLRTWEDVDADRFDARAVVLGALFQEIYIRFTRETRPVQTTLTPEEDTQRNTLISQMRQQLAPGIPRHILRATLLALLDELESR